MLRHLELSAGGDAATRILGQPERICLGERAVSLIISEHLLIGPHLQQWDISCRKRWTHPVARIN